MWTAYVFAGRPTPVDPEAFKIVAALDLSLMVPALTVGGILRSTRLSRFDGAWRVHQASSRSGARWPSARRWSRFSC
jgi:hypothetical protein